MNKKRASPASLAGQYAVSHRRRVDGGDIKSVLPPALIRTSTLDKSAAGPDGTSTPPPQEVGQPEGPPARVGPPHRPQARLGHRPPTGLFHDVGVHHRCR